MVEGHRVLCLEDVCLATMRRNLEHGAHLAVLTPTAIKLLIGFVAGENSSSRY